MAGSFFMEALMRYGIPYMGSKFQSTLPMRGATNYNHGDYNKAYGKIFRCTY